MNKQTEALKLALEALEGAEALLLSMGLTHLIVYGDAEKAITALLEALAEQPAQPSKPWVGLTDEEWQEIDASLNDKRDLARIFTRAIEAKLKEKNA